MPSQRRGRSPKQRERRGGSPSTGRPHKKHKQKRKRDKQKRTKEHREEPKVKPLVEYDDISSDEDYLTTPSPTSSRVSPEVEIINSRGLSPGTAIKIYKNAQEERNSPNIRNVPRQGRGMNSRFQEQQTRSYRADARSFNRGYSPEPMRPIDVDRFQPRGSPTSYGRPMPRYTSNYSPPRKRHSPSPPKRRQRRSPSPLMYRGRGSPRHRSRSPSRSPSYPRYVMFGRGLEKRAPYSLMLVKHQQMVGRLFVNVNLHCHGY